jgi:hypothetical protein
MVGKDGCKRTLEAATISDILYLFGQGKVREFLKTGGCGNHVYNVAV